MRTGNIPTDRIAPVLSLAIRQRWPHGGGLEVLAEKVGCDQSTIEGVIDMDNPGIEFDFADRLLCGVGAQGTWWGELADIYYGTDLSYGTCDSPLCNKLFRERQYGPNLKRFCCRECKTQAWKLERGILTGQRLKNRCPKGHKFSQENTTIRPDGRRLCRTCKNNRRRERMKDPEFRAKQREWERRSHAARRAA